MGKLIERQRDEVDTLYPVTLLPLLGSPVASTVAFACPEDASSEVAYCLRDALGKERRAVRRVFPAVPGVLSLARYGDGVGHVDVGPDDALREWPPSTLPRPFLHLADAFVEPLGHVNGDLAPFEETLGVLHLPEDRVERIEAPLTPSRSTARPAVVVDPERPPEGPVVDRHAHRPAAVDVAHVTRLRDEAIEELSEHVVRRCEVEVEGRNAEVKQRVVLVERRDVDAEAETLR